MSIPKPTSAELRAWDKLLQGKGLGMERGHNSARLIYGHDNNRATAETVTFEDVAVFGRPQPKTHKKASKSERNCLVCGGRFAAARSHAKYCTAKCRKRLERSHR